MEVSGSSFIFHVLYMDDILLASNDLALLHETKDMLNILKRFSIHACKLGEVSIVKGDKFGRDQCPENNIEKNTGRL